MGEAGRDEGRDEGREPGREDGREPVDIGVRADESVSLSVSSVAHTSGDSEQRRQSRVRGVCVCEQPFKLGSSKPSAEMRTSPHANTYGLAQFLLRA